MYDIIKDDEKIKKIEDCINDFVPENVLDTKEHYLNYINNTDVNGWFVKNKYYNIRLGLYDTSKKIYIYKRLSNLQFF